MKRSTLAVLLLACTILVPSIAAAQLKAYVSQFAVTPPDAGTLKTTLQTLLSSRIASDSVTPVAAASEADVVITGSYTQIGKVFSLDAVAKLGSGSTLATVFEQGESQDDLIPALGRMAAKLKGEISKRYAQAPAAPVATPAAAQVVPAQVQPAQIAARQGSAAWVSQRLAGALVSVAPAVTRAEGREFFVADNQTVRLYRQEKTLKLLAETSFPPREKVIAIDTAGPDQNGNPRVYVTVMDGDEPSSKIFSFEEGKLKPVATKLPYLFRAIAFNGGKSRIYAQQMSVNEEFFGDLYEVSEAGGKVELQNPIKLPRYANVFNYNRVTGPDGASYSTVFSSGGFLIVYNAAGEEIWRSDEKFGGSETFFKRETGNSVRDLDGKFKWTFIDQRITVTRDGEIIVPQNTGFLVVGNSRSYSKHSLVGLTWNGSSLEESWRTKQGQNYLADYFYEPDSKELVLLEVVQREGIFGKGGSAVRVLRAQ